MADSISNYSDIPAFDKWDVHSYRYVQSFRLGKYELQPMLLGRLLSWRRSFDVIIFLGNPNILTTWIGLLVCRILGIKTLLWTHGWISPDSRIRGLVRDTFYRLANGLLLYGARAKELGLARGVDSSRMFVVGNSLDYELQKSLREALEPRNLGSTRLDLFGFSCPAVLCSARVTKLSAQRLIVDAIERLRARNIDVGLVLIGDGEDLAYITEEVTRKGFNHRFFGALYDEARIAEITTACDMTVSPGKVGLTAMQSMAYGIPVISHGTMELQMPEVEAIIPGVTGDLFAYGDATDLARVIERWLKLLEEGRAEVRRNCIQVIEDRFCPAVQVREICRAVNSVLAGRAP